MRRDSSKLRNVTPARRGQIIQHVLVDGWSPAQAAAAYGITERHVVRWLAAYSRHGMACLREDATADGALRRWCRRVRALGARISAAFRGNRQALPARCIVLRRRDDDRDARPVSARRSLWN